MTNQSHTELAAQAREWAAHLEAANLGRTDKLIASTLLACARALESPERVQGEAAISHHMALVQAYDTREPSTTLEVVEASARGLQAAKPSQQEAPGAAIDKYLIRARWPDGIETYLDVRGVYDLGGKIGIDVNAPEGHPLADNHTTKGNTP